MAYTRQWSSTSPGCLIVLLDQSFSMTRPFGEARLGAKRRKADMVATVLNSLLHEFVRANTVGAMVKPRAEVAILGYGGKNGTVHSELPIGKPFMSLPELLMSPLRIETRNQKEVDEDGQVVEIPISFPVWVEAKAGGKTPMCAALRKATALAEQWVESHQNSYPPVIINVTDGGASDGDPTIPARELTMIHTQDGQALLFTCHITEKQADTIEFPDNIASVPAAKHARLLFSISSLVPDTARAYILANTGVQLLPGARGFIFNGDAGSVRQMFVFATVAQTQEYVPASTASPNR